MSAVITFLIVAAIVTVAWVAVAFLGWVLIHGAAILERHNKATK